MATTRTGDYRLWGSVVPAGFWPSAGIKVDHSTIWHWSSAMLQNSFIDNGSTSNSLTGLRAWVRPPSHVRWMVLAIRGSILRATIDFFTSSFPRSGTESAESLSRRALRHSARQLRVINTDSAPDLSGCNRGSPAVWRFALDSMHRPVQKPETTSSNRPPRDQAMRRGEAKISGICGSTANSRWL
jgi:hypothetical protein